MKLSQKLAAAAALTFAGGTVLVAALSFADTAPIGTVTVSGSGTGAVPIATTTVAGKVKVGAGLGVTTDGTLSVTAAVMPNRTTLASIGAGPTYKGQPIAPLATTLRPGLVKVGSGLSVTPDGTLNNTGVAGVASFKGRGGAVLPAADDYSIGQISGAAAVAATGSYADLSGKPVLAPVATSGSYTDLTSKPSLSAVATSGSYLDLSNKPSIPAAQVSADWNSSTSPTQILNKPTIPSALSQLTQSPLFRTVTDTEKATWNGNTAPVSSVFGRTGAVTAQTGDYTAAQVGADPLGAATSVQMNLDALTVSLGNAAFSNRTSYPRTNAASSAIADTDKVPFVRGGWLSTTWSAIKNTLKTFFDGFYAPSVVVKPTGDTSGVSDLANINAAISSLPASGGTVYLDNTGAFYLPTGTTGIQLGNGTNSTNSTKSGIRLIGVGKGGTVNGGRGGVIINSAVAGPAIQVNGPLAGWELNGVEVNITSTSSAARGLKVISAQAGNVPYFAVDISNPSQIAVEETTTTNTGAAGSNTMRNQWGHVQVWMSAAATNAVAWKSTGAAYPTFNTCNEMVDNLMVYTNHSTQTGVVLGAADTISFRQYILWNSGAASKGIIFDYGNGQNPAWPADCTFFSLDIGTSTITNNGTPTGATKNKIFGMGLTNGGALPSLANLYVGDAPSLADLADWPAAVSVTKVGYLSSVTSDIQAQINSKAAASSLPSTATSSTAGLVTVSGNTTKAASVSGTLTQGKQATFDLNGNLIASAYDTGATGGGAVNWGGIGGTLASQTDLNSALAGKQVTLVNQTNIKSVNGISLLGSGDLIVSGMVYPAAGVPVSTGSAWGTSLSYGFGANNLLQLNSDGNIFLKATNGTNTQFDLQARNSGGTIVSDWITAATVTPQYTIYDAINGHNVIALTPGAPENSFAMDSAGKIGFGTGSPLFALHSLSSTSQGAVLLLEDYFTGNGASGGIFGRFGRGSATSPLRGKANDRIFTIGARSAYAADDASAGTMPSGNRVAINFFNAEDQTSGAQGSYISFLTTAPSTPTNSEKMRINGDGSIQIGGTYGDGFGAGNLNVANGVTAKTFAPTIQTAATYGATTTFDLSLGQHPSVTLTGNPTLAFTNPQVGASYRLTLKQDATGNRTVTWPSFCTFITQAGTRTTTGPTLHTAANTEDTIIIIPTSLTTADCYARGY